MNENKNTAFEAAFYTYLKRALNNPSLLDKNAGELRAILNDIRFLSKPGELDAILPGLWELKLVTPKPFNNPSSVIIEIERNIKNIVRSPQIEKARIYQKIESVYSKKKPKATPEANRKKVSDKITKSITDFIRS